jgi:hypothetical protein
MVRGVVIDPRTEEIMGSDEAKDVRFFRKFMAKFDFRRFEGNIPFHFHTIFQAPANPDERAVQADSGEHQVRHVRVMRVPVYSRGRAKHGNHSATFDAIGTMCLMMRVGRFGQFSR